jgi:hypothetical protein
VARIGNVQVSLGTPFAAWLLHDNQIAKSADILATDWRGDY